MILVHNGRITSWPSHSPFPCSNLTSRQCLLAVPRWQLANTLYNQLPSITLPLPYSAPFHLSAPPPLPPHFRLALQHLLGLSSLQPRQTPLQLSPGQIRPPGILPPLDGHPRPHLVLVGTAPRLGASENRLLPLLHLLQRGLDPPTRFLGSRSPLATLPRMAAERIETKSRLCRGDDHRRDRVELAQGVVEHFQIGGGAWL